MMWSKTKRYIAFLSLFLLYPGIFCACTQRLPVVTGNSEMLGQSNIFAADDAVQQSDMLSQEDAAASAAVSSLQESDDISTAENESTPQVLDIGMPESLWEKLQARAQRAAKPEELEMDGFSFEERCTLVILWSLLQNEKLNYWYGLVDLTRDGCPEIFSQQWSGQVAEVLIYDISGTYAVEVAAIPSGSEGISENAGWEQENDQDTWHVFATEYPDGTPGGIIETTDHSRGHFTCFFTIEQQIPRLENMLQIKERCMLAALGAGWELQMELRQAAITEDGEKTYISLQQTEKWLLDDDHIQESVAAFYNSLNGTPFYTLYNLPRQPWGTPLIRSEIILCYEKLLEDNTLWKIRQMAEDLNTTYTVVAATDS